MICAHQGWEPREVRTLFLSDVHLGCRHTQAEAVLAFLKTIHPQRVFLVGDFLDAWRLKRRWRWSPTYDAIIEHLLDWAEVGIPIGYTPGNHDNFLRHGGGFLEPLRRARLVTIRDEFTCTLADGRRLAVLHGDQFDPIERHVQWLSVLSSFVYDQLLSLNWWISRVLPAEDRNPYRLCGRLKNLVKRSIYFMQKFEDRVFSYAEQRGLDGVICGHLHTPRIVTRDDLTYCNVGDWIENCAAVVENFDGELELIRYYDRTSNNNCVSTPPADVRPEFSWSARHSTEHELQPV